MKRDIYSIVLTIGAVLAFASFASLGGAVFFNPGVAYQDATPEYEARFYQELFIADLFLYAFLLLFLSGTIAVAAAERLRLHSKTTQPPSNAS